MATLARERPKRRRGLTTWGGVKHFAAPGRAGSEILVGGDADDYGAVVDPLNVDGRTVCNVDGETQRGPAPEHECHGPASVGRKRIRAGQARAGRNDDSALIVGKLCPGDIAGAIEREIADQVEAATHCAEAGASHIQCKVRLQGSVATAAAR